MRKKDTTLQQLNKNAGFSLLEVLVAMIILAIIAIPLMRGFVVTSRTNANTRKLARADAVAQNLMEALNPYTLENVCEQFNSTENDGFFMMTNQIIGTEIPDSETASSVIASGVNAHIYPFVLDDGSNQSAFLRKEIILNGHKTVSWADGAFVEQGTDNTDVTENINKYAFAIKNIYEDGEYYDARIDLDASGYRIKDAATSYNIAQYSEVASYSPKKDYMFLQDYTDDQVKIQEIKLALGDDTIAADTIGANTIRTITVDITGSAASSTVKTSVSYKYTGSTSGTDTYTAPSDITYNSQEYVGTEEEAYPRNLFICYAPNYYSTRSNSPSAYLDNIIVNNTAGIPLNLCIIKQKIGADSEISAKEMNYRVRVKVSEPQTTFSEANPTKITKILTNLGTNLANSDSETATTEIANQAFYNYEAKNGGTTGSATAVNKKISISGLDNTQNSNRMFDVTVSVYESGAYAAGFTGYEPLLTLSSEDG